MRGLPNGSPLSFLVAEATSFALFYKKGVGMPGALVHIVVLGITILFLFSRMMFCCESEDDRLRERGVCYEGRLVDGEEDVGIYGTSLVKIK